MNRETKRRLLDEFGWLLGDLIALVVIAIFLPLYPLLNLFDQVRDYERDDE